MQVQSSNNPFHQAQAVNKYQSAAVGQTANTSETAAALAAVAAGNTSAQSKTAAVATTPTKVAATTASTDPQVNLSSQGKTLAATASSKAATASYRMDTNLGSKSLNLDNYFNNSSQTQTYSSQPALLPSMSNVKALTSHAASELSSLMQQQGISTPPSEISFDENGNLQLPADYQYKSQLTQALQENTGVSRELKTLDALAGMVAGVDQTATASQGATAATAADVKLTVASNGTLGIMANQQRLV